MKCLTVKDMSGLLELISMGVGGSPAGSYKCWCGNPATLFKADPPTRHKASFQVANVSLQAKANTAQL